MGDFLHDDLFFSVLDPLKINYSTLRSLTITLDKYSQSPPRVTNYLRHVDGTFFVYKKKKAPITNRLNDPQSRYSS